VLANTALVMASTLLTLLLIEGGLRLAGYEPLRAMAAGKDLVLRRSEDPAIGYELIPGTEGRAFKTDVVVNSLGFRSPEPATGEDVRRVVFLGDSITFGSELPAGTPFPDLLAARLEAIDARFDVQNLALSGYDALQEVAVLERRGLQLDPEVIVVGFCLNDAGVVSANLEYLGRMNAYAKNPRLLQSRLGQLLLVRLDRLQGRRFEEAANDPAAFRKTYADRIAPIGEDDARLRALMREAPAELPSGWYRDEDRVGRLRYAFERLSMLRDLHGFRVLLVVFPLHELDAAGTYPHRIAHAIVGIEAQRLNLPVIDLLGSFQREGLVGLRNHPGDPVHPSPRGHVIAAGLVEAWFRREGIL
jgi:lysophospholipase L1-like esterase